MDSKKVFWLIAAIVALAGIAVVVAVFVTKYMRNKQEVEELGEYVDELESICCDDEAYDFDSEEEIAE